MAVGTGRSLVLSSILLLLFVWLQTLSKSSEIFRWPFYSSFIFIALGTLLLVSSNTGYASKTTRRLFHGVVLIAILVAVGVIFSIATFPPGGTRHYFAIKPNNIQIDLEYSLMGTGNQGYLGSSTQTILDAKYPVGGVRLYYELHGLHVFTNKSIVSNATVWFAIDLFPNYSYDSIERLETATSFHNGTESSFSFRDHTFAIRWGSSTPEWRVRLDKGYSLTIFVGVKLEGPNQGGLKATIPFTESIYGDDVEVSTQLEDGIAILLSGIFAGALLSIPVKQVKPRIMKQASPILNRINKVMATVQEPKSFFKNCIRCNKQIPIASEECPHCGAKQLQKKNK